MRREPGTYTIGKMAEICNISKKQLRYYDQNGILSPQYRNPETNYRLYTENQIEEILLLQELKSLDFPLKDIKRMLSDRKLYKLQDVLEERLYTLRVETAAVQKKYNLTMDILMRITNGMIERQQPENQAKIELRSFAPRSVLSTRYVSSWNANNSFIVRRAELFRLAEDLKVKLEGANLAIFHSGYLKQFSSHPEDQSGDLEVCMNLAEPHKAAPNCRTLGPFQAVSCVFTGHYKHMEGPYLAMECWAQNQGIELSGVSVEEYLIGATMTQNSDDYVTRLYLPVKGSEV